MEFVSSGVIVEYVDLDGNWILYSPTEEDIRDRDAQIVAKAKLEWTVESLYQKASGWFGTGFVAIIAGLLMGYCGRKKKGQEGPSTPSDRA
jgi:hypothetical protein